MAFQIAMQRIAYCVSYVDGLAGIICQYTVRFGRSVLRTIPVFHSGAVCSVAPAVCTGWPRNHNLDGKLRQIVFRALLDILLYEQCVHILLEEFSRTSASFGVSPMKESYYFVNFAQYYLSHIRHRFCFPFFVV